jgi:hypothetical protein
MAGAFRIATLQKSYVDGPRVQGLSKQLWRYGRVQSYIRPTDAVHMTAGPVWTARKGRGWLSKISGRSKAVMCPASLCGSMTAGPDRFRERHPNRWAVFIYHGPARIFSFVGSTDYYLLLRP